MADIQAVTFLMQFFIREIEVWDWHKALQKCPNNKGKVIKIALKKDVQVFALQGVSFHFWVVLHSCGQIHERVLAEEISGVIFEFLIYCFVERQALPLLGKRPWGPFMEFVGSAEVKHSLWLP